MIKVPKLVHQKGDLAFIENKLLPFKIRRVYYIYDIPRGGARGGHAHKKLNQFIIPVSGSFDITLNDGKKEKTFHMKHAHIGLYVSAMLWRTLNHFSANAICLVLASEPYDETDYYRDYQEFKNALKKRARLHK